MNEKCQVFTPENYVKELLDSSGYINNLYGKKLLENSCGDGNILTAAVERYIIDCVTNGFSKKQIAIGLERDIYGIEIDPKQYEKCIKKLNDVLQKKGISPIKWHIYNTDYLRWNEKLIFEFIVGNPPYITYSELKKEEQEYVKATFETCEKGKFDYCYAFIEKSVKSLANDGKMAYLIPSSIFKTVFGQNLRNCIKPYLQEIIDYTQDKMFDDALVKSAIMVLDKRKQNKEFFYYDVANNHRISIPLDSLGSKWLFTKDAIVGERRFGDYFQVSHVVATLLNEAFVLKAEDYIKVEGFYRCNGMDIEETVVKETATPRSLRYNKTEKIIFPYHYKEDRLIRYTEKEFQDNFPGANAYLETYREKLEKRKRDKNALWFEYGRSQALTGLNQEKLLVSTIVTDNVTVYSLNQQCIPYAGMYIVPKSGNEEYTLKDARGILESDMFINYVEQVGVHISGKSIRITSKDIENFKF